MLAPFLSASLHDTELRDRRAVVAFFVRACAMPRANIEFRQLCRDSQLRESVPHQGPAAQYEGEMRGPAASTPGERTFHFIAGLIIDSTQTHQITFGC